MHGGSGLKFGAIEALRRRPDARFLNLCIVLMKIRPVFLLIAKKRSALRHQARISRENRTEVLFCFSDGLSGKQL